MRTLLAAALLAGALTGCGGERAVPPPSASGIADPVASLQAFYDALAAADSATAVAWMLPLSDPELEDELAADLGEVIAIASTGALRLEAKEADVQGDWALVVARHVLERDGVPDVLIHGETLYRTERGWRVASEPMRADPLVAPLWNADAEALVHRYRTAYDDLVARYR